MERIGILLAICVAIAWGLADVCATLAARRLGTITTTFISLLVSVVTLGIFGAVGFRGLGLTLEVVVLSMPIGVLTGVMAAAGYATFYRGLELGPVAIVSPLAATDGAIAAILAIVLLHEGVSTWQVGILSAIIVGIVLAATNLEELQRFLRPGRAGDAPVGKGGIRWGLVAMLGFGVMLFGIGAASVRWGWFLPIFWTRFFGALALGGLMGWRGFRARGTAHSEDKGEHKGFVLLRRGLGAALGVGLFETAGLVMYSVGTQVASTSIVGPISSTFALIPIVAGMTFFRERPLVNQLVGVGVVTVGLVLLGIKPV